MGSIRVVLADSKTTQQWLAHCALTIMDASAKATAPRRKDSA